MRSLIYMYICLSLCLTAGKLPDTGQTSDYTETFGEDSDYTIHAPSFSDHGDGTISDNITGLMWQQTDGGEMTWERAVVYADTLSLGGHNDWRLPTPREALNILNLDRLNPAFDTDYFTKTDAEYWWTNTHRADDSSRIWVTNAGGGIGPHPKSETISAGGTKRFHVRCVRGEQTGSQLVDNGNGTISDSSTGLMWQQSEPGELTWEAALTYCEQLEFAEYDDWRLPNIKELRSISDDRLVKPSLNITFFPDATASRYWSSTSEMHSGSRAWFVDFKFGLTSYEEKSAQLHVRAVRGGLTSPSRFETADEDLHQPHAYQVHPAYPNPFNASTRISFQLKESQHVSISVFNVQGQKVARLMDGLQQQGDHRLFWHAGDAQSGTYFIRFRIGDQRTTQKCVLLK